MKVLNVFFNGTPVGEYRRESSGREEFEYHEDWLNDGFRLSISLPLRGDVFRGSTVRNVFGNVLPDDADTRSSIAENVGAEDDSDFHLLAEIGRDCVGSFQFLPEGKTPNKPWEIEYDPVSEEELTERIQSLEFKPLGLDDNREFRISLAGNHEKTTLLRYKNQWNVPLNTTPSSHIFKPQNSQKRSIFDLDENEYFCMKLAKNLDLPVPNLNFKRYGPKTCLIIDRFDRKWKEDELYRIHTEDFCQALNRPRTQKYLQGSEDLMTECLRLLEETENPPRDQLRFIQHHIFQWLIGADDGHLKNFSLYLSNDEKTEERVRLAPFYDISSVEPYNKDNPEAPDDYPYPRRERPQQLDFDPSLVIPLAGSKRQRIRDIDPEDFHDIARHCSVRRDAVERSVEALSEAILPAFKTTADETGDVVPGYVLDPIEHGIKKRLQKIS